MCCEFKILTIFLALVVMAKAQQGKEPNVLPLRPTTQNATKCYTCDSPVSCLAPTIKACDQKSANTTRSILAKHFPNVSNVTNTQFECTQISYNLKNSIALAVQGCVNAGVNPCKLQPKNLSYTLNVCQSCTKSLCNPAGTFSSSFAIMMSTLFGLLLLKCLYF